MEDKNAILKENAQLLKEKIKALEVSTTQKPIIVYGKTTDADNACRNQIRTNITKMNSHPLIEQTSAVIGYG